MFNWIFMVSFVLNVSDVICCLILLSFVFVLSWTLIQIFLYFLSFKLLD